MTKGYVPGLAVAKSAAGADGPRCLHGGGTLMSALRSAPWTSLDSRCRQVTDRRPRPFVYAFLANFGIAVTKGGAAIYTNSGSMLAEAIHSVADCLNQVLLFVGLRARRAAADDAASARLRQVELFLELHRRADAVQHGRAVLDLRRLAQAARPRGAQQGLGRAHRARCRDRARNGEPDGVSARDPQDPRRQAVSSNGCEHTRDAELVVVLGEDIAALDRARDRVRLRLARIGDRRPAL